MVIRSLLNDTVAELKNHNIENAIFDANLIVRNVLGLKPIDMVLSYSKEVSAEHVEKVKEYTKRRCENEPLQYILGTQEFMGIEFKVKEGVLVPRADTETLVESVLGTGKGANILDICTGSGCIALSIAKFNKNAHVIGVDISENALEVAEENAKNLELTDRVRFYKLDIMNEIPKGIFDIVVSNPPYIVKKEIDKLQNEVKLYEPHIALDGGEDGLDFYRRIIEIAPVFLQENGKLYFEVGYEQAKIVSDMMKEKFTDIEIKKDLCGIDRVVIGKIRGGRSF